MKNKYGIFQSTGTSCVFYKEDEDGNQSTFNIFATSDGERNERKVFAFVDNEMIRQQSWFGTSDVTIKDIMEAFRQWAADAPFMFEFDAQQSMNQCLGSHMKKPDSE